MPSYRDVSKLIEFTSSDGHTVFYVEAVDNIESTGLEKAGVKQLDFGAALQKLKAFSDDLIQYINSHSLKPDSTTLEFGFNFSVEGNIFIAKASGEASVKVSMHWNRPKE